MRTLSPADLPDIEALLAAVGLPTRDLDARIAFVGVRTDAARLVGVAGLETAGTWGLIRSVAVRAEARGQGIGARLVEAIEAEARRIGVADLVLLTTTAEAFFVARGYTPADRRTLPADVLALSEFCDICPASAACLTKRVQ